MKSINHLNHKLVELWRWNAAVGKRNEAAVAHGFHKIRLVIGKLSTPLIAYARSWDSSFIDARQLPKMIHGIVGPAALLLCHVLTGCVALPDDPMGQFMVFGFWSYLSAWASQIAMLIFPQPYAWLARNGGTVLETRDEGTLNFTFELKPTHRQSAIIFTHQLTEVKSKSIT